MNGTWGGAAAAATYDLAVAGSTMHVVDTGPPSTSGRAVLTFLHGNPTSSFLWRHVAGHLSKDFRCVGLDLIGMGGSGKPELGYTWSDHRTHLTAALDALEVSDLPMVLVLHDWGVGLGLEYARTHPDRVAGAAFLEGHLRPLESWDAFDPAGRELFRELRDPVLGRRRIEEDNFFLDVVLPSGMNHQLTPEERRAYHLPFPTAESRHPLWVWVTQIPIAGDPPDVAAVLRANYSWLRTTTTPLMLLHASPGAVIDQPYVTQIAADCPGIRIASVGDGLHFLPEDQPGAIARQLQSWLASWS